MFLSFADSVIICLSFLSSTNFLVDSMVDTTGSAARVFAAEAGKQIDRVSVAVVSVPGDGMSWKEILTGKKVKLG